MSGHIVFTDNTIAATGTNPTAPSTGFQSYVETNGSDKLYAQFGTGVRIGLRADHLHFTPEVRFLVPLVGSGTVIRVNAGITYDFPLD